MATVKYKSKENAGHKFWTARYGRYAIRIDANQPGVYPWLITLEGRSVRKGVAPARGEAAAAVSDALDELSPLEVVDVMLDDCGLPASVMSASDLHVELSALAIISCRSPTSDGLATA